MDVYQVFETWVAFLWNFWSWGFSCFLRLNVHLTVIIGCTGNEFLRGMSFVVA